MFHLVILIQIYILAKKSVQSSRMLQFAEFEAIYHGAEL